MGKPSAFVFAILLIGSIQQFDLSAAVAQDSSSDDTSCASGIYSSLDGSCVGGEDQTESGFGDMNNPSGNEENGYPSSQNPSMEDLSQQYPGLESTNQGRETMGRITNFYDRSGLTPTESRQQALYEAQQLALLNRVPPTDFQRMVRASVGNWLPVYGDSLFRMVPSTFAPLDQIPVTPDYVIGPGDQLVVRIWGQVNFNAMITVDRAGSVYLPQVGEIHVAGLQYSQLQDHMRDAIGRIYKNFNLAVEMGQLRSIQVFVVGQARRPGNYTLSSLSTLVTAIFSTGGPSVQGSLRDIQVKRNGQTITHFDLYDLLIGGDKSKDIPLLPGDVIYIPPVGPQVAVTGSVRNPGIYELKDTTSVAEVLRFAGGLSAVASVLRASVDRIDDHKNRIAADISLEGAGLGMPMREGDILRVLPVSPEFEKTITLRGNVYEPGRFAWHPGMKLSEIIPNSQSLVTRDYWERRNRLGIPGPAFKPEYANNPDLYPRNPSGTLRKRYNCFPNRNGNNRQQPAGNSSGSQNPYVASPSNPDQNTGQNSQQNPSNEGMNQSQNCLQPTDSDTDTDTDTGTENMNPLYPQGSQSNNGQDQNLTGTALGGGLQEQRPKPEAPPRPPLNIALPVPEIDWSYAVIERMNPQTLTTTLVPFNPGKLVLEHDPSQDLELQAGDVVTIFSQEDINVPQAQRTKFVRLSGEFKQAGIYSVKPGETLRELVVRAGGITPDAYLFGSEFTRESTRVIQQRRLNAYISNLELEIDRSTINTAASNLTAQDAASSATEVAASKNLVDKFRSLRATGRIVLAIAPTAYGVDNIPDIPLEDGDAFMIPSRPDMVNVVGAVYDQNAFLFNEHQHLAAYLRLAGGPTREADRRHSFIIRADGSVISRPSENGIFGNTFASIRMNPGDTIIVPEKIARPSLVRSFSNYTTIFSQIALGAAAIAVLR